MRQLITVLAIVRRLSVAVLALSLFMGAAPASPKRRNAEILARVLSYERTLEQRVGEAVGVAVVYQPNDQASEANADVWMVAFNELATVKVNNRRFFAVKVPFGREELAAAVERDGVDVFLVCDGLVAESPAIADIARARRVLTASNEVSGVERHLTLCVAEVGEKTKIFINLNHAQLEGIRFASALLALANLVH